jgi:hypothetical protein
LFTRADKTENTTKLFSASPVIDMGYIVVLLYTLSLALRSSLCHRLGKEGHEFSNRAPLVERERG